VKKMFEPMQKASRAECELCVRLLPYGPSFLFVDRILEMGSESVLGTHTFRPDAFFFSDHFPDKPVTPGAVLIECMAQIGLVAWGLFLSKTHYTQKAKPFAFTHAEVEFLLPVFPGQQVFVRAHKVYFRLGKLKVRAEMFNTHEEPVCRGELSGMILREKSDP
jgi:3-hydroxyacyl-[acyl-carrier-protein] dehydratase